MTNELFKSLLISKIISDLPIWIIESEWQRIYIMLVFTMMLYVYQVGKKKRA